MMTEGRTGFRAFNEGTKEDREADFVALRQALARATPWSPELVESLLPAAKTEGRR
jgi:6-oxo-cyclohex-1-ene-carbonyl-CoA hydrolase